MVKPVTWEPSALRSLRKTLFELQNPGSNELHREKLAGNALAFAYAEAVRQLLEKTNLRPVDITAIGESMAKPFSSPATPW